MELPPPSTPTTTTYLLLLLLLLLLLTIYYYYYYYYDDDDNNNIIICYLPLLILLLLLQQLLATTTDYYDEPLLLTTPQGPEELHSLAVRQDGHGMGDNSSAGGDAGNIDMSLTFILEEARHRACIPADGEDAEDAEVEDEGEVDDEEEDFLMSGHFPIPTCPTQVWGHNKGVLTVALADKGAATTCQYQ